MSLEPQDCGAKPDNRIVQENRLPGSPSTEWDINGPGRSDDSRFRSRHQYQSRRDDFLQDKNGLDRLSD